jgi:hypothetical protein
MRVVYEPWVYYGATGTCRNLDGWAAERLDPQPVTYGVTVSNLVKGKHRLIELNHLPGSIERLAFRATEGTGSIADGTFEPREYEILDVLPNGIHHYAVYDLDGNLLPGGTPEVSPAGQPGRCMWCHESQWTQRGSDENVSTAPHISYDDFLIEAEQVDVVADARRKQLNTILRFEGDAHTWGEWLAEMFLHTSPERLAREWHTTPAEVERILAKLEILTVPSRSERPSTRTRRRSSTSSARSETTRSKGGRSRTSPSRRNRTRVNTTPRRCCSRAPSSTRCSWIAARLPRAFRPRDK